jgi:hypothetical protein
MQDAVHGQNAAHACTTAIMHISHCFDEGQHRDVTQQLIKT